AVKAGRPHTSPISQEKLSMLDKDWLFLATINAEGDDALAQAEKSSAYQRLAVVKNKNEVPVDGQIWTSANGVLAAHAILDTIEDAIPQTQPKYYGPSFCYAHTTARLRGLILAPQPSQFVIRGRRHHTVASPQRFMGCRHRRRPFCTV